MQLKTRTWLLLSLLAFLAAGLFWRLGNDYAARRRPAAPPSVPLGTNAGMSNRSPLPPLLTRPVTTPAIPASPVSRFRLRLSNSPKPIGELQRAGTAVLLQNALLDTALPLDLAIPPHLRAVAAPGSYIVQSRGTLDDAFRARLREAGAEIIAYIPNNAYLVRASAAGARQMAAHPATQSVLPYEPYYKLDESLLAEAVANESGPQRRRLNVVLFPGQSAAARANLSALGAAVLGEDRSPFGPLLVVDAAAAQLSALAQLSEVQTIETHFSRVPMNDLARVATAIAADSSTAVNHLSLDGANVLVAVVDSGVEETHPDLTPRVFPSDPFTGIDFIGHGTFVAGVIASSGANSPGATNASGSASNANFRGMAPASKIFALPTDTVAGVVQSDSYLQERAAATNAIISNNSWGYAGAHDYNIAAASYDAAVRDALPGVTGPQPVLFVFAAGNDGGGNKTGQGGAPGTLTSPATAKNVISVGAVEQPRFITNEVSRSSMTNQEFLADTDSNNQIADFSSRGNVGVGAEGEFGRFKPDVVAPGTFLVSTRSSQWTNATSFNNLRVNTFRNISIPPGATNFYDIFLNPNETKVRIHILTNNASPFPFAFDNLPIHATTDGTPPDSGDFVGTSNVVVTGVSGGGIVNYAIANIGTSNLVFDLQTLVTRTNDPGDYFLVLSNLNNALGPYYRYESGTSMAAPVVSGMLALMQQFFEQGALRLTNTPALMKALVINGARSVASTYEINPRAFINHQGWGQVNFTNTLPANLADAANRSLHFFDQTHTNALVTGQSYTNFVTVNAAQTNAAKFPLRITLVWTDPPGNPAAGVKLVNDLDLIVTTVTSDANGPVTNVFLGNHFASGTNFVEPLLLTAANATNAEQLVELARDSVNNVENVYIDQPSNTTYSVAVVARKVNVNAVTTQTNGVAQDFALVISCGDPTLNNPYTVTAQPVAFDPLPRVVAITNGQVLIGQRTGAHFPQVTNTVRLLPLSPGDPTNFFLSIGVTNQWNFYVFTNTTAFTNVAFLTFFPPNLAFVQANNDSLRNDANPRTSQEADIDLYVSTNCALTNLDPVVLASAYRSRLRGGTESVVLTNATAGQVFCVGVKSEDQQAAEFGFFASASLLPFSSDEGGTNLVLRGIPVPADIPDGAPDRPGGVQVFAVSPTPITVRRVTVTNVVSHELFGDLQASLAHNTEVAILQNRSFPTNAPDGTNVWVYDDSDENDNAVAQRTDPPGSLRLFAGDEGLGVWTLTVVDTALHHTGRVEQFTVVLDKQQDLTNGLGSSFTIQPGATREEFITVPLEATNLTVIISVTSGAPPNPPLDVQVCPVRALATACHSFTVDELLETNSISIGDSPPLLDGQYVIRITNPAGGSAVTLNIQARLDLGLQGSQKLTFASTAQIDLLDDAWTNSVITVANTQRVSAVQVGVRIAHERMSDLVLHLVSPSGKRILLAENRGGLTPNSYGAGMLTTNALPPLNSAGGAAEERFILPIAQNVGVVSIDYDFRCAPDDLRLYYDGVLIFDSGYVSNGPADALGNCPPTLPGNFSVEFGPGNSTNLLLVMNEGSVAYSTAWYVTNTIYGGLLVYTTFTENTNLTTTPIKFAEPPFGTTNITRLGVFTNGFELVATTNYVALTNFDGWQVLTNLVTVVSNSTVANDGTNYLVLRSGRITRFLPTLEGVRYALSYAHRFNPVPVVNDGFEIPGLSGYTTIPPGPLVGGWRVETGDVDAVATNFWQSARGAVSVDLNDIGTVISTNVATVPGQSYSVSFAYAGNPLAAAAVKSMQVQFGTNSPVSVSFDTTGQTTANMGWTYTNFTFVAHTNTARLAFRNTTPGAVDYGPTLDDVTVTPVGVARVSLNGTNATLVTGGAGWQTNTVTFTAPINNSLLDIEGIDSGLLLDSFELTRLDFGNFYLPEEPLTGLIGERANGNWKLEVWDNRTGATNLATLLGWQLQLTLENTNRTAFRLPPGALNPGQLPPGGVQFFSVFAPSLATGATHTVTASGNVRLSYNPEVLPDAGVSGSVVLLASTTNGSRTLKSSGTPPTFRPGHEYYLAVENLSATESVTFGLRVDFAEGSAPPPNFTQLPDGFAFTTNLPAGAGLQYFQFDVSSNAIAAVFEVLNPAGDVKLFIRPGTPPTSASFAYRSDAPGAADEWLRVTLNDTPALTAGRWYLGVQNLEPGAVTYAVRVTQQLANIIPLFHGVPVAGFATLDDLVQTNFYRFTAGPATSGLVFELSGLTGDVDLLARRGGLPGLSAADASSRNYGTQRERIVIRAGEAFPSLAGDWYLVPLMNDYDPVNFTVRALAGTGGIITNGEPILIASNAEIVPGRGLRLIWNSIEGERYRVDFSTDLSGWNELSHVTAEGATATYTDDQPVASQLQRFYRVVQVP